MQLNRTNIENSASSFTSLDKDWGADDDYLFNFACQPDGSVLQIACGTGALSEALSQEKVSVVGLDRNPKKIAQAVKRTNDVKWVKADARMVRLSQKFDRIIITGNAFQAFATNTDQILVLQTIASHLKPNGKFAFGMENPKACPWEKWGQKGKPLRVRSVEGQDVSLWQDTAGPDKNGLVFMQTHYKSGGRHISKSNMRRFVHRDHIRDLLEAVGLQATMSYGDWATMSQNDTAPYIIVSGGLSA
ncbi:Glycine/sarcosine N-methyltransferase [Pseudovibrio axinellae]|uniref:Glycine/sarcosine N-methyltransferase n=1 Tax=Pseudovibrio axinellae TaxID=989403 RepID=A0A165YHF1_9HYPH|nr:class I SAM-dependent methyltransferase [Pseudovibrio axinellae]KZL18845.1 Glycine/sarcosine N-methyltransferase [Pseudovibrio axinellae]SEP90629.1 Methyltransferase domain-containing protein [Pseudovibrio axinellae]